MAAETALLHLEALPPQTTKGTLIRLLEQVGGLEKLKVGVIELRGRTATVEVPAAWLARLVKALDGTQVGTQWIRARSAPSRATTVATGVAREDHFLQLSRWLDWEGEAEAEQLLRESRRKDGRAAEESGLSLVDLTIRDEVPGLGDRVLVTLSKRNAQQTLPWTRLTSGSPVILSEPGAGANTGWRGVVCDRDATTIQIALPTSPESSSERPTFRLDLTSDEVTRLRMRAALERARMASGDRLAHLRDVLLGEKPPRFAASIPWVPCDETLNDSQRQAIEFALAAEDVAILHGPPGTGKTTAVVELIRQAVRRGLRVLACAPSNLAVDNLLDRLAAAGERVVRLGHPARVLPTLREHTLDMLLEEHSDVKLARKLVKEAAALQNAAARYTRAKPPPGAKQELRSEARQMLADARRLESVATQQVLDQASIVCATTTGLDSEVLGQRTFGLAVIDEACQTTEPACWIPVLRAERLVLAGDHCQLPPTVVSAPARREGFGISLLERLMELGTEPWSRRLTVQYRMHQQIMGFSSAEFYDGSLVAAPSVRDHLLAQLPEVQDNSWTASPLAFWDTAGAGYDEAQEPDGESRWNPREAAIVQHCVEQLLEAGLPAENLAVITPYSAQVRHLREILPIENLEIDTVDGFQGREKEAVVVSLVRSNPQGEIGFLADTRRMNVALTRARRKLVVIGDSATVAGEPFYARLLQYFEDHGAYHTVWELA